MSLQETLNKHSKATLVVVMGVIVLAFGVAAYRMSGDSSGPSTKAFYTDDDGKTTFVDSVDRYPPFDHGGKIAVRAAVFTSDGGKTQFVGYLERYTPAAIQKLQAADADRQAGKPVKPNVGGPEILLDGTEVKKPGETKWIAPQDRAGRNRVVTVSSQTGGVIDSVLP
ncbi:MAG: hypothetical protein JWM57_2191 [Phycisphaerales bacterium]|nr:hypothetical protein [Phycisphaerales bacterium]